MPPSLLPVLRRLEAAYLEATRDSSFDVELQRLLGRSVERPTPLEVAGGMTRRLGGATIHFKREDQDPSGGTFINAVVGQSLLARRMGYRHVVADAGSGDTALALAETAQSLGLRCTVFMTQAETRRRTTLVSRMHAYQATVHAVDGGGTLHEAMSAAWQYWVANSETTSYVAGAPIGPHPYPLIVRDFQAVIGREVRAQLLERGDRLPQAIVAATGGVALGLFSAFVDDPSVRLIAVEGGGTSLMPGHHAAPLTLGRPGVLHGAKTSVLQDEGGQILPTRSVASSLMYPGAAPELAWWRQRGRLETWVVRDHQAIEALHVACEEENLRPSLETCHALAAGAQMARLLPADCLIVIPIVGSCDGDMDGQRPSHPARRQVTA